MTTPCCRFFAILLIIAAVSSVSVAATGVPKTGQPSPPFKTVTTSGQTVSLDSYKGQVLIIDFFATWCKPCRQSVPHLVELQRKFGKQGLHIVGMSVDEADRSLKSFLEDLRVNYPVAIANETVQADFGLRSVPVMYVVDKRGKIAERFAGYNDEIGRSLEHLVKKLLAEK